MGWLHARRIGWLIRIAKTKVMEVIIYFNRLKWLFGNGNCRTEGHTA